MPKDRKIDMVILGLLSHEKLTGYEIKKRIDGGISYFWKGSFGSIYPSLTAMENEGLVIKQDTVIEGGREKIYYDITETGREKLVEWLKDSKAVNDLKYETLLKVFFGGVVASDITLQTIDEFEINIKKDLEMLKIYKRNLEAVLDSNQHTHFYLTVLFGVETYEAYLKWCKEAKKILKK